MKELQNYIYRHMDALKHHKRYLAMLTALSMLVTFIVPLILIEPADSMSGILICGQEEHTHNDECYDGDTLVCGLNEHIHTEDCYLKYSSALRGNGNNDGGQNVDVYNAFGADANYDAKTDKYYSPESVPLYTLLFGEGTGHWVDSGASLEDNLLRVGQEYFLGYASDFCAFIEGDFIAYDADAEGRMFVGGDLIFRGQPGGSEWNYQVGAGDYGHSIPIWETDEYNGITGFASGIIGGKVYRLGTMTTFSTVTRDYGLEHPLPENRTLDRHFSGYDIFLYPEEGAYKKFIVGNLEDSLHLDEDYLERNPDGLKDVPYETSCNHLYFKKEGQADNTYCGLCNNKTDEAMEAEHKYLSNVNEKAQFYNYSGVNTILEKTFDTLRARSMSLGSIDALETTINGDTLVLNATNIGDAKTVYFNVRDWDKIADTTIRNIQIIVPPERVTFTEDGDKEEEFALNSAKTIKNLDLNIIISCDDPTIEIPRSISTYIKAGENGETPDDGKGYRISNAGTPNVAQSNATNNHHVSSNILYNFYNATLVDFSGEQGGIGAGEGANFNGTILAPNAHVESEKLCPGHLSGALIAKSFEGGLEFGYRPYRGGVDIFGMVSGYGIPVNKYVEGKLEDGEPVYLPGALFAIKEDAKFVSLFESGKETNFAALPSRVDFSGNGPYKAEKIDQNKGDRPYIGTEIQGEKLTASVSYELYSDSGCTNKIGENVGNVLPKFYLKANQELNFDFNENYNATLIDETNHIYEIQLLKPVTGLTITARNKGDSEVLKTATVNFGAMTLSVGMKNGNAEDGYTVGETVNFTIDKAPAGDVTYKYFINGSEIENYNNNEGYQFKPENLGGVTFSVSAYVDGYEIAQATATKINVTDFSFSSDMAFIVPDSIISGNDLTLNVENAPEDATIEYYIGQGGNFTKIDNNVYNTYGVVGKDFVVKAVIKANGKEITLQDSVTINFGTDIEYGAYPNTSDPETATKYNYDVSPYDNFNFWLTNVGNYLDRVAENNKKITFYFNDKPLTNTGFNNATKDHKQIGDYYTYAIIEANGLQHTVYGPSGTIKYNDKLGLFVPDGPHTAGNNINVNVFDAPDGAKVKFEAYDSNGTKVEWSEERDISGCTCNVVFTPQKSGDYTIIATLKFAENDNKILTATIPVVGRPVTGDLYISANEANTGVEVGLKVTNAPEDADVVFTITDPYGSTSTLTGNYDNGEHKNTFTPKLAGDYSIVAKISKDNVSKTTEAKTLKVNEKTTTLTGYLSLSSGGITDPETVAPGTSIMVNVTDITIGATLYICVRNPGGNVVWEETVTNNSGTYNREFIANDVGAYTVTGSISSGAQNQPLSEKKVIATGTIEIEAKSGTNEQGKFVVGTPVTLGLANIPSNAVRVDYYLSSYNSNSPMQDVGIDATYNADMTITFPPKQAGTHEYTAKAIDANGNVIATVTEYFETVQKSYDDFTITLDKEFYYHGETVTVTLSGTPENLNNVQTYIEDIGGVNNFVIVESGKTYTFTAPSHINVETTRELTFSVFLNDGSSVSVSTNITIKPPEQASNVQPASLSYAFRRYLEILAEQNLEDNVVSIKDEQNRRIGDLRITFLGNIYESQGKFKINVEFIHRDGSKTNKDYDTVSGSNPYYIDIPAGDFTGDVTEIKITPVEGAVTIDKCYPTFYKNENKITKTSSRGFTLLKDEVQEIPVEEWVKALDSITLNLGSDQNATISYALVEKVEEGGEPKAPVFKEVTVQNASSIGATNLNVENIEKILVYTTAASLTVKDYTISGFTEKEYTPDEQENLKNHDYDIINFYTLVEQQAPTGYFKEETIYNIEVKETIKLNELQVIGEGEGEEVYPTVVYTTITVKKKDGTIALQYTVEVHPETDGVYDANSRKLTIHNTDGTTTFKVRKDANDEVEVLSADNNPIAKSSSTFKFDYDGKDYYLDPGALMIVPVPDPIEYKNRTGLLFRKVDNNGIPVQDALIELYKEVNGEFVNVEGVRNDDDTGWITQPDPIGSYWNWTQGSTTECLLPIEELESNVTYKFHEANVSDKYELAKDIFFKKISDTQIEYWEEGGDSVTIDISTNNVIRMSDYKIPGIKLKIGKVGENNQALEGAVFDLYAEGDFKIKENINAGDGKGVEIDFSDTTKLEEGAERYVERGYLKPGSYYLIETTIPEHTDNDKWYEDPGKIGFRVKDDFTVECYDYSATASQLKTGNGSDNPWGYWLIFNDKSMKEPDSGGKIENVTNIYVVLTPYQGNTINIKECWTNNNPISNEPITTSSSTVKFEQSGNNYTLNWTMDSPKDFTQFKITGSDMVVSYVKITTADGTEHIFKEPDYVLEDSGNTPENEDEKIPALTVDGNTITVGNNVGENSRDIKVNKKWLGDNGFEEFRKPVTITLYQSRTEITDRDKLTDAMKYKKNGEVYTITLNEASNWTGAFEDVEVKYLDESDGKYKDYYYYIKEATIENYATTYETKPDGTLIVNNTLETVEIPVQKHWANDTGQEIAYPENITVQLQMLVDNDGSGPAIPQWEDVPDKLLTLTQAGEWKGTFSGLAKGHSYRVKEASVKIGWQVDDSLTDIVTVDENGNISEQKGSVDNTLEITNKPQAENLSNLEIQKLWDSYENLPDSIKVRLFRKTLYATYPIGQPATSVTNEDGSVTVGVQDDYARLLQYSLYFYDANMCGDTAAENSAIAWRGDCHTDDEIKGGFHDAGDHVMFGLPQGYSASMLGWSFYEFNTTAEEDKKVYDNLGQTEHIKKITEHFCDFFVQAAHFVDGNEENAISEILVQKGAGNPDHQYWGPPENQPSRNDSVTLTDDGRGATGWNNGQWTLDNEMFWVSDSGADIAAEYAAALALAYLNFNDGSDKYSNYLTMAEKFYQFAQGKGVLDDWGINKDELATIQQYPGFYKSDGADDDRAWAAGWLYLATGRSNNDYKNACFNLDNDVGSWAFSWNDVKLAAACVSAHVNNNDKADPWKKVREYVSGKAGDGFYRPEANNCWGTARYNAALQMAALALTKNDSQSDYKNWAKAQMAMILGNNTWNNGKSVCLVTGFAENSAKYAHHRAASGWQSLEEYKNPAHTTYAADSQTLIGAMVGGPYFGAHTDAQMTNYGHKNLLESHDYLDDLHDYCCNEVALDYQAGLVGAAAGLYYFFKTGSTFEIPGNSIETQYVTASAASVPTLLMGPQVVSMQKTAVNVLADGEQELLINSSTHPDEFADLKSGADLSELLDNKTVTRLEVSFENLNFELKLNGDYATLYNGGGATGVSVDTNNVLTAIPTEYYNNGIKSLGFKDKWNNNYVDVNNVTGIKINYWNNTVYYVKIFYVENTSTYTVTGDSSLTVGTEGNFTVTGGMSGSITWSYKLNGGSANTISGHTGTTCKFTPTEAGSYEIIATDSSGNSASKTVEVTEQAQQPAPTLTFTDGSTSKEVNVGTPVYINYSPSDAQISVPSGLRRDGNTIYTDTAGNYTITATANNQTVSITLNVTQQAQQPAPTLTINGSNSAEANVGEWISFAYTPDSDATVITYTNDSNQQSGLEFNWNEKKVKGVTAGTYTITATANNQTASVTLTITDNSSGGGSTGITAPENHKLIHTMEVNDNEGNDKVFGNDTIFSKYDNRGEGVPNVPDELLDKTIDYIIVEFKSDRKYGTLDYNGALTYNFDEGGNNGVQKRFNASNSNNGTTDWPCQIVNDVVYIPVQPGVTLDSLKFEAWYNGDNNVTVKNIYFYSKKPTPTITGKPTKFMTGNTVQLEAINFEGTDIKWEIVEQGGTQASIDENSGLLTAGSTTGTIKVRASSGEEVAEIEIPIVQFEFGFADSQAEFNVREGNTLTIGFNTTNSVQITLNENEFVRLVDGTYSFEALKATTASVPFTASCNGSTIEGRINVLSEFKITEVPVIYNGQTIELSANAIDDVNWSIESGEEYASLNGNKLTGIKKGTVVVKATDQTDGSTATISIAVKIGAVGPGFDISKGYEPVLVDGKEVIDILASEDWTKKITNLEIKDSDGNYYMYFFAECDQTGKLISGGSGDQIAGKNGACFVPLEYQNGTVLTQGISTGLSVKNSLAVEAQGTLPSTGGSGVTTYYYLGGVIMLLSIAGFTGLKRRERKRRKE